MAFQKTIQNSVTFEGIGLHTGLYAHVCLKPAPENTGIVFIRTDLDEPTPIPALAEYVCDTSRCTVLQKGKASVHTIEHLLASIHAFEIDNIFIEIDNAEVPILDGSAAPYLAILAEAKIQAQKAARQYLSINEVITFVDEQKNAEYTFIPADHFSLHTSIDYSDNLLGTQFAELKNLQDFAEEIAPARTFCFLHEIEGLLEQNLIQGGSLDNAIVFAGRQLSETELHKLSAHFGDVAVSVDYSDGILNNTRLRYRNEAARHKLLDILGDLCLVGMPIKGKIFATRPGHASNVKFAKHLRQYLKSKQPPVVDMNAPSVVDIKGIMDMLPHRYPFLLIDKILKVSDTEVIGAKMVSINEAFFQGHFPGEPVMPGVLQIEAMAQTGGILLMRTVDNPQEYLTYFLKIDQVKFRKIVVPGDALLFHLQLLSPIRRGICEMRGEAFVGKQLVTEAILTAKIEKK
ncbi:MAG: bifunctional UDP-3-O-[3-hydroxymyristoyl] N-acetylglucosamine deacetylase/3-hydroxyacyl-ACP dehydratase [Chitinophagales bacterium]|nr:bifunctional UDP-3-O-[3-hydroxymyristoyl] N-acetylglucosamine deacetylase/3-hydroxyacyl-ACP dehydratase [Bacteroidota bacterium]MCB9042157.1 bifunctional UDP-3-O-[3-hydroxymyristoyl] N-acetylglucosamine deacetylase/3-hydroxyacyl-ACP dehydratase [Chitinophagales bacterium]